MAQWVKDLAFVTAAALVTAVVRVQSLAFELPHGCSQKKKKNERKEKKNQNIIGRITQHHIFLER